MKSLWQSRRFQAGLLLKLLCLPFFGSTFARDLFIPFLDHGVLHPLSNPWAVFPPANFPYGSVLYGILWLPRFVAYHLLGNWALGHTPLSMALLKLPLLGLDVWLLQLLLKLSPKRERQLIGYYWLNPVLFFITYVHVQLDVAATAFCFAALYSVMNDRVRRGAVLLALATLCKSHVVVVIPFVIAYLWNRSFALTAVKRIGAFCLIWPTLTLLGFLPHLHAGSLHYVTTSSPEAFRVFAAQIDLGSGRLLYLGVSVVLALLGRLCIATRISELGLLYGSGTLFGALILVTSAMPGWYYWSLPFLCLFYANYLVPPRILFAAHCALYLLFFGFLVEYNPDLSPLVYGNVFTLLQTSFAGLLVAMWLIAVRHEAPLQGRARPLLIGIAGDSGTGKNVLTDSLSALFEGKSTALLEGDDYHKWERGHAKWADYTHLDPKANDLQELAVHTSLLISGRLVFQPHYDHKSGTFTAPREIGGSKLVIVQGLHTLYMRDMRDMLDLKIFLAPHPLVRLAWKIRRDVDERGHRLQDVIAAINRRKYDADTHINPQRTLADWIIEVLPKGHLTDADIINGAIPSLRTRHTLWNDAPVLELFRALHDETACEVELIAAPGDINRIEFFVEGELDAGAVGRLAERLFPHLRSLTRVRTPPYWQGGYQGINQLLALSLLSKRA